MLTKEKCDQRFDFFWDLNPTKYKYDGLGRRIVRNLVDEINSSKSYARKYVYNGQQVIAILDGTDKLLSAYVFGSEIDQPSAMVTDSDNDGDLDVLSLHLDHLGSVRMITNSARQILEEIHYSAYGETQIKRRGQQVSRVINNYYYTGREMEPETGDYYYRARYYDPYSQKFLSEDKTELILLDNNRYRYVANRPLNLKDPLGWDYRMCDRPLDGLSFEFYPIRHDYIEYSDGSTTSFGPKKGFYGEGKNNTNDKGGECGSWVETHPKQDEAMKEWADKNQNRPYIYPISDCRDFIEDAIKAGL